MIALILPASLTMDIPSSCRILHSTNGVPTSSVCISSWNSTDLNVIGCDSYHVLWLANKLLYALWVKVGVWSPGQNTGNSACDTNFAFSMVTKRAAWFMWCGHHTVGPPPISPQGPRANILVECIDRACLTCRGCVLNLRFGGLFLQHNFPNVHWTDLTCF